MIDAYCRGTAEDTVWRQNNPLIEHALRSGSTRYVASLSASQPSVYVVGGAACLIRPSSHPVVRFRKPERLQRMPLIQDVVVAAVSWKQSAKRIKA